MFKPQLITQSNTPPRPLGLMCQIPHSDLYFRGHQCVIRRDIMSQTVNDMWTLVYVVCGMYKVYTVHTHTNTHTKAHTYNIHFIVHSYKHTHTRHKHRTWCSPYVTIKPSRNKITDSRVFSCDKLTQPRDTTTWHNHVIQPRDKTTWQEVYIMMNVVKDHCVNVRQTWSGKWKLWK